MCLSPASILLFPDSRQRFSRLAKFLPFLPVFGGGSSRFQPVYVDDIARAVETVCRNDSRIEPLVNRKIIEAGGPDSVYSFCTRFI